MSSFYLSPFPSLEDDDIKGLHLSASQFNYSPEDDDDDIEICLNTKHCYNNSNINSQMLQVSPTSSHPSSEAYSIQQACASSQRLFLPDDDDDDGHVDNTPKQLSFRLQPRPSQHHYDDKVNTEMMMIDNVNDIEIFHRRRRRQQQATNMMSINDGIHDDDDDDDNNEESSSTLQTPFQLQPRRRSSRHTRCNATIHDIEIDLSQLSFDSSDYMSTPVVTDGDNSSAMMENDMNNSSS